MRQSDGKNHVISSIYEAALDATKLSDFLSAWDEYVFDPALQSTGLNDRGGVDTEILIEHARQALEIFKIKKRSGPREIREFIEDKKYAAFVTDIHGNVRAINGPASSRFSLAIGDSIFKLDIDNHSRHQFQQSIRLYHKNKGVYLNRVLPLRIIQEDGRSVLLIAEVMQDAQLEKSDAADFVFFKSCIPEWTEIAADLIEKSFDFSNAEIEVLQLLMEGFTIRQIAEQRARSALTITKQVKALLRKAEVNSQSELIRLINGILHICSKSHVSMDHHLNDWRSGAVFQRLGKYEIHEACTVQFTHFGVEGGVPFLLIQGNSSPVVPRALVEAVAAHNIQIVSPFKPGSGETTPDESGYDPDRHMSNCLKMMAGLGFKAIHLAGHCMGAIYCLKGALAAPKLVRSVTLIDTGAPITSRQTILEMPPNSRRTFLAARETPDVIHAPYAIAADLFFKDEAGKQLIMKLAYADSQIDTALMRSPVIANVVERNLSYTLADAQRAVDDLILWMQDWTDMHDQVASFCPTTFLHGAQHDWLPADDVIAFCKNRANTSALIIPDAAQLWIYNQQEIFAAGLAATI